MGEGSEDLAVRSAPHASAPSQKGFLALTSWYRARLQPLLVAHSPDHANAMEAIVARADARRARDPEVRCGVVGESGVGKSTLLNALMSERLTILPQGGVGPLTAVPVEVRYASEPFARIRCLGRSRLQELLGAMRLDSLVPNTNAERSQLRAKRQMARLLTGESRYSAQNQNVALEFLQACLNCADPSGRLPDLSERLASVVETAHRGDSSRPDLEICAGTDLPLMLSTLTKHAAGYLAPLTAAIEIGWDAPVLRDGLVLVDLPGSGVANDHYRIRAKEALENLDVVLWVVGRSGLTQSSVELLAASGHDRAASASAGPTAAPARHVVAITRLDESVDEAMHVARRNGARICWTDAFKACAGRASELVRKQLELAGEQHSKSELTDAAVVPVLPREYQRFHRRDPDEPSRLQDPAQSGIPAVSNTLQELARSVRGDLLSMLKQCVDLIASGPAHTEAKRLSHELLSLAQRSTG